MAQRKSNVDTYIFYKPERLLIYREFPVCQKSDFLFFVKRIHKFIYSSMELVFCLKRFGSCVIIIIIIFIASSFLQFSVIFVLIELRFFFSFSLQWVLIEYVSLKTFNLRI